MQKSYKWKMVIAYDGTGYRGWQSQPNTRSIQETIQKALQKLTHESIHVIGAGRTDSGVHALGQVAHFSCIKKLNKQTALLALNHLLPSDIRILNLTSVPLTFHAQHNATKKIYHYYLETHSICHPFMRNYRMHYHQKLDLCLLKQACKYFVGTHDFTSFANERGDKNKLKKTIKTLHSLRCIEKETELILQFEGDGFLYKMVRNIVSTLIDVASQKLPLNAIQKLLALKDRKAVGQPAPPQGLFLMKVFYLEKR